MTYFLHLLLTSLSSAAAEALFDAQGSIAPGTEGLWKVWGARLAEVRPGDLILIKEGEGSKFLLIQGTFEAKARPAREGFFADGESFTYGALAPVIVLRWGTGHHLSRYL